jgi:hypothetical protein
MTIEVDVSGIYNDPKTDMGIPATIIEQARETASLIGGDIIQHFSVAMHELGVRKLIFKSVPSDDPHIALRRELGDVDIFYTYILSFDGVPPTGVDVEKNCIRVNNLIMSDAIKPFIKDGIGNYQHGVPNRLSDMIGSLSSRYRPERKYPVIYMKLGI